MIGDGGFKAHGAGLGPKLGASLASGPTGLQRRIELARERERAAIEARRKAADGASGVLLVQDRHLEAIKAADAVRAGGEQGTGGVVVAVKGKSGPKGGRPREIEGRPWEAEGVSRRTWERRRRAGSGSMNEKEGKDG